ncbi:MAG: hypothetical protein M4579_002872 [Chaenotheca gracillima]|nr:MAG: hypothetical protein M4579_002872 [Chaenotheca gracillima]
MENGTARNIGDDRNEEPRAGPIRSGDGGLPGAGGGHKRSLSGSILARLPFLRSSFEEPEPAMTDAPSSTRTQASDTSQREDHSQRSMSTSVQQQKKSRRRKGSLRKTAILGTGKMRVEGRERRGSTLLSVDTNHLGKQAYQMGMSAEGSPEGDSSRTTPNGLTMQNFTFPPGGSSGNILYPDDSFSGRMGTQERSIDGGLESFVPNPPLGETSTTDEEDQLTMPRQGTSTVHQDAAMKDSLSSGSDSYFPPQLNTLQRRRSGNRPTSPLSALPVSPSTVSDEWDYSQTEWWGWAILIVTWVVFVVGMGSCLEVWSWAWDVGETPYAPPELEDDPTLPIVGYYPALIILTSVMAWVWVVVAWMGMKYFKHAKIGGEDI